MFNKKSFTEARKNHAKHIVKILDHVKECTNLKIKDCEIKLGDKASIKASVESLDLGNARGVYGFFVESKQVNLIRKQLESYRLSRPIEIKFREAVPFPNPQNEAKEGCIYIGMIREKNLQHRILEHLIGTKSPRTGALKLHEWARGLKKIKIGYVVFPQAEDYHLIEEYEKALWNYYKPAIGKL